MLSKNIIFLLIDLFDENIELSMELVQHMEEYLQAEIQVRIFMLESWLEVYEILYKDLKDLLRSHSIDVTERFNDMGKLKLVMVVRF